MENFLHKPLNLNAFNDFDQSINIFLANGVNITIFKIVTLFQ